MLNLLKFGITASNRSRGGFKEVNKDLKGVKGMLASVSQQANRTGRSMRNIGAGLSAGVTAPLVAIGKRMVTAYDAQVQAENAVAQAIASTGGAAGKTLKELKGLAAGIQDVTTYGDEDILRNVTAPLLTFTKVQGDVFDRAQASVVDYATLLKMDLKSASLQVGKALQDPIKGVTALGRAGVVFTDAQRDMIKSMVEGGDVAAAQGLILKELETQFKGQAAVAAAAPLGQWRQLSNLIGDVKEQLGEQAVPFLKPLIDNVKQGVAWFSQLSPEVKKNTVLVGGLAAVVGPLVAGLGLMVMGITSVGTAMAGMATLLAANPIGLALTAIAGGAYLIYRNWDGISTWFAEKWGLVSDVFDRTWLGIKGLLDGSYSPGALLKDAWRGIGDWFSERLSGVQTAFAGVWAGIQGEVQTWPGRMLTWMRTTFSAIIVAIKEKVAGAGAAIREIWGAIRDEIASWPGRMYQAGVDTVKGLFDGMRSEPGNKAGRNLGRQVISGAKEALDSHSPSRVFMDIGRDVVDGLAIGLEQNSGLAVGAMRSVTGEVQKEAQKTTGFMSDVRSGALTTFKSVLTGAQSLRSGLGQMLGGFGNKLLDTGLGGLFDLIWPFAKGGVLSKGRVIPYANGGVVDRPTFFGMSGGNTGLMGEAGPEAIMPLERGPGGRLGVRAQGGGGNAQSVQVNFAPTYHIDNSDAQAIAQLQADNRALAASFETRLHRFLKQGQNRRLNKAWQPS